jgi:hypothetical protein
MELELAEGMAPVRAPHDLWRRVEEARRPAGRVAAQRQASWQLSARMAFCSVVALVGLGTVTMWGLVDRHRPMDFERMALQELQGSELAALRSSDAAEVSGWLGRNVGIQVDIPQTDVAKITGARVVERGGVRMGEVLYQVKGIKAALRVGKASAAAAVQGHGHRTWESRGVSYALACAAPESERLECLLCHVAL